MVKTYPSKTSAEKAYGRPAHNNFLRRVTCKFTDLTGGNYEVLIIVQQYWRSQRSEKYSLCSDWSEKTKAVFHPGNICEFRLSWHLEIFKISKFHLFLFWYRRVWSTPNIGRHLVQHPWSAISVWAWYRNLQYRTERVESDIISDIRIKFYPISDI